MKTKKALGGLLDLLGSLAFDCLVQVPALPRVFAGYQQVWHGEAAFGNVKHW